MTLNAFNSLNMEATIKRPNPTIDAFLGQSGTATTVASSVRCALALRESIATSRVPGITIGQNGVELNNIVNALFPDNKWIAWETGVSEKAIVENDVVLITKANGVSLSTAEQVRYTFSVQEVRRNDRHASGTRYLIQAIVMKRPERET